MQLLEGTSPSAKALAIDKPAVDDLQLVEAVLLARTLHHGDTEDTEKTI
jgi:hypothetical protein